MQEPLLGPVEVRGLTIGSRSYTEKVGAFRSIWSCRCPRNRALGLGEKIRSLPENRREDQRDESSVAQQIVEGALAHVGRAGAMNFPPLESVAIDPQEMPPYEAIISRAGVEVVSTKPGIRRLTPEVETSRRLRPIAIPVMRRCRGR